MPPVRTHLAGAVCCLAVVSFGARVPAAAPGAVGERYPKLASEPFGRGIFAHARRPGGRPARGPPIADLARNPYIAGSQLSYTWSELEPDDGAYRWDLIDADLEPWARAGKKCWIEISTCDKRAVGRFAPLGTPNWLFSRGVPKIQADQTATYPVFWNDPYQALWGRFVRRLADRYDGDPRLEFVATGGYSSGHEPNLSSRDNALLMDQWRAAGFDGFTTSGTYFRAAVRPILALFHDAFRKTPVAQTIHVKSEFDNAINRLAASYGFILMSNGMSIKVATAAGRQQWRDRRERYQTRVGYAEWGPAGRGGKGNRRVGKRRAGGGRRQDHRPAGAAERPRRPDRNPTRAATLMDVYRGVLGDDADPALRPASRLSYVPLGMRLPEVETDEEWTAALRWASEHLAP